MSGPNTPQIPTATIELQGVSIDAEVSLPQGARQEHIRLTIQRVIINMPNYNPSVQERYSHIYILISVVSGLTLLLGILLLSIYIPNPSIFQLRVWLGVFALAAAGLSTTITGMLNVKVSFGAQLTIGAAGALAVLVLFYFFNPAVLS